MSIPVSSQLDLYNLFTNIFQDYAPDVTDLNEGSVFDSEGGVFSVGGTEFTRLVIDQFAKCFIATAQGPDENGGGSDDLQTLAVDRYGSQFARPAATFAVDTATFSRASNAAGVVTILAGTVIKDLPDPNGNVIRYATNSTVTLTHGGANDLSISVGVTATTAGSASNASAGTLTVIETPLTDPTVVVTNAGNVTGTDALDSPDYRTFIYNLILSLTGATKAAIQAKALTVPGVVVATAVLVEMTVINWNPSTNLPVPSAEPFRIPFVTLYIADNTGGASPTLIAEVQAAIATVDAYGVYITVTGATPITVNWTAHMVLNPSGPNYATLVTNPTAILNSMTSYINTLAATTNFVIATANAAILAIWGAAGSNDITSFTTSVPSGDVAIGASQKAVPGTMALI